GTTFRRQINIHARAEANQPEALTDADRIAFACESHNASGYQPCDLHDTDLSARRHHDDETAPFVLFARLVELSIEEGARHVDRARDAASNRCAIDVYVEDVEEDRDAGPRLRAK